MNSFSVLASAPRARSSTLRQTWLLLIVLALVALLGACSNNPATPAASADSTGAAEAESTSVPVEAGDTWQGIPVGFTAEGHPFKGNPNAPVTLAIYSDYQCPFCARHFVNTEPGLIENYVRPGKVRMVFHDLPLKELHPNALAAHEVARCVADQGAPLYWALYDALYMAQDEWAQQPDPAATFERLAGEVGADVDELKACVGSGSKQAAITQAVADASALGFDGTPSFQVIDEATGAGYSIIGAQPYARFAEALDAVLAGNAPPTPAEAQSPSVPFWATTAGMALDPARPGLTMAGDQTRGSADAGVVVIEFSDFQCPYCKQHAQQTQPELDKQFVDTGDVRWIYKSFPLPIHPQAPAAGVAAECASDQGKYVEMHDALFESVTTWSITDPTPIFIQLATEVGLDATAFATCLADPAIAERVEADRTDGVSYVQGTPTFIILNGSGGRIIPGALPLATFSAELQKAVDGE